MSKKKMILWMNGSGTKDFSHLNTVELTFDRITVPPIPVSAFRDGTWMVIVEEYLGDWVHMNVRVLDE